MSKQESMITLNIDPMGDSIIRMLYEIANDFADWEDNDGGNTNQEALETIKDHILYWGETFASDLEAEGQEEEAAWWHATTNKIEKERRASFLDNAISAWRNDPANNLLNAALAANAADANAHPENLYRAGVFAGMVEAAAAAIYARPEICGEYDDIHAIEEAIYQAYGVAW